MRFTCPRAPPCWLAANLIGISRVIRSRFRTFAVVLTAASFRDRETPSHLQAVVYACSLLPLHIRGTVPSSNCFHEIDTESEQEDEEPDTEHDHSIYRVPRESKKTDDEIESHSPPKRQYRMIFFTLQEGGKWIQ